ncbi:hypothetical protein MPSI1_003749 [Malassezia psittaci]|uniref:Acyl-CoA thioesterase II n=1 Tax=Malassezia psittaci TaxID=1821823 RepID=A0AAF0JFH0_9BASI|nr:hypothetical protein MPSI1_003749 [Malassezia psittaci]
MSNGNDADLLRLIGVRKTDDPWVFESVSLPGRAGNQQPIAFGGCALAVGLNAAGQTIEAEPRFVPYSITGQFLGPAVLDQLYIAEVKPIRDTRSFRTRYVTVKQMMRGKLRPILVVTLDMIASPLSTRQALDKAKASGKNPGHIQSLLRYQIDAPSVLDDVAKLESTDQNLKRRLESGEIEQHHVDIFYEFLGLWTKIFDARFVPESIMTQNMIGFKDGPTTQDHLPIAQRRVYDWFRLFQQLPPANGDNQLTAGGPDGQLPQTSVMAHLCAIAFALDGLLAFAPISMAKNSLMNVAAASSLDFAQRYHTDVLDANQWLLREVQTIHAGWQRTYTQANLFDQHGELVATCTQQSVLRPAPGAVDDEDDQQTKAKL